MDVLLAEWNDYQMKGFSRGFNACLDKLEGR